MLVDKKREKMYYECLERKKKLDRKLAAARGILLVPPLLLLIGLIIMLFMLMFSDIFVMAAGALIYGYQSKGASIVFLFDFIVYSGFALMAANLTVFRTKFFLDKCVIIYSAGICVSFLALIFFGYNPVYLVLSVVSLLTGLWNRRLVAEDEKMSLLDGYPHFDPALMRHTDVPFVPPTKEELDGMTADERIMYEREH